MTNLSGTKCAIILKWLPIETHLPSWCRITAKASQITVQNTVTSVWNPWTESFFLQKFLPLELALDDRSELFNRIQFWGRIIKQVGFTSICLFRYYIMSFDIARLKSNFFHLSFHNKGWLLCKCKQISTCTKMEINCMPFFYKILKSITALLT